MSHRYHAIARSVARSIETGAIAIGEKVPSLRSIARREGVSLMTALSAYRELEAHGYIEAVPRSGYRARARPPTAEEPHARRAARLPTPTMRRTQIVADVLGAVADPTLEPLGLGCPTPDAFPLSSLRRLTGQLLGSHPDLWVTYSPPPGHPELRRHVAARLRLRGLDVDADDVLLTSGGTEALSLALSVSVRRDEIAVVSCPTFFGILDAARGVGARVLEVPEDADGIATGALADALARHPARVAVLVPSFANPTGSVTDPDRRADVVRTLARHGVALVEDDLYAELAFDGRPPPPLAAAAHAAGVPWMLVGSFSKTLVPGGRVGYVVAKEPWMALLREKKRVSTLANVTLSEALLAAYLREGRYEAHLRRLTHRFAGNLARLQDGVAAWFPKGTRISRPRGGFLLWLELPAGLDGLVLFHLAREAGISVAPGLVFTLGAGFERHLRLNGGATLRDPMTLRRLGALAHRARADAAPARAMLR